MLCQGDSLRLSAYDSVAKYFWSTGDSSLGITVKKGGIYWVQGEYNNNGCPFSDSIALTSVPGIHFSLPDDTTLCNNQTLLLAPGIANANYYWQDGSNQQTFAVNGPGIYRVRVASADYSCIKWDTIEVNYINAQQVFLGNDTMVCAGMVLSLQPNLPVAKYLWSNGAVSNQIIVNQTGDYWLKVNNGSCTVADTIRIVFSNPPNLFLGKDTSLCLPDRLALNAGVANGAYLWQDGSTANSFSVTRPGTFWLQLQKDGCTVTDSIVVSYYPGAVINLGPDIRLCTGKDTVLNAGSGFTQYQWSNGVKGPVLVATTPGNYTITATTINACKVRDTLQLLAPFPLPIVLLNHNTSICMNEERVLDAGNNFAAYLWNDGTTSTVKTVKGTGFYSVTVTDIHGCKGRDSVLINKEILLPVNFLPADTAICFYATLTIAPLKRFANYLWNNGATTSVVTFTKPGIYTLVVTDKDNCKGKDTITIHPKDCMQGLYVPSAFSPDNNGKNDIFKPFLFGNIVKYAFTVYNRYGAVVFHSVKPGEGWNGYYKGVLQETSSFIWTSSYQLETMPMKVEKGTVTILH